MNLKSEADSLSLEDRFLLHVSVCSILNFAASHLIASPRWSIPKDQKQSATRSQASIRQIAASLNALSFKGLFGAVRCIRPRTDQIDWTLDISPSYNIQWCCGVRAMGKVKSNTYSLLKRLSTLLRPYDLLDEERARTAEVARQAFNSVERRTCSLCGAGSSSGRRIIAAHIFPLEEGGKTEKSNLIPLCDCGSALRSIAAALNAHKGMDAAEALGAVDTGDGKHAESFLADVGCHQFADSGLLSRSRLRKLANDRANWGKQENDRQSILRLPPKRFDIDFNPGAGRQRLINLAVRNVVDSQVGSEAWVQAVCVVIGMARRFSGRQKNAILRRACSELRSWLSSPAASGSPKFLDRAYYELALVSMIDLPLPDLDEAIKLLERSCECAKNTGNMKGYAMSRLEWVHAKSLAATAIAASEYEELLEAQDESVGILLGGKSDDTPHSSRWRLTRLMHSAKLHIKAGNIEAAEASCAKAWTFREELDVFTGWRTTQAYHLNIVGGAIHALRGDYSPALSKLARALSPIMAGRGKRPEGQKDIANCAAWVFARTGDERSSIAAAEIGHALVDGRSGFWMH